MKIDWIRMEYVVDPEMFRGGPTPEEKALHCLFQEPPIPEKAVPLESLLPGFTIRVYINDQLGWNELCDFEELGKMLQPGSGTFRPFVTRCSCPDCETGIDKIHSINTGEWIDWTTLFPHGHPTGCGGSVACGSCPKRDWTLCNFHEQREVKRYRFSAGQFRDEVLALARTVRLSTAAGKRCWAAHSSRRKRNQSFARFWKTAKMPCSCGSTGPTAKSGKRRSNSFCKQTFPS